MSSSSEEEEEDQAPIDKIINLDRDKRKNASKTYIGDYEVGKIIGSGMIGVALVARHWQTKLLFCLKCMSHEKIVQKNLADSINREISILVDLTGKPHIMPLLKILNREKDMVLIFPYLAGGDLFRFMK